MADDDVPAYQLEFYEDELGHEPALAFMRSLDGLSRRAIGVALHEVLEYLGPDVAAGNFGKNLGGGLYEFRLDQNAEQILHRKGKEARCEPEKGKILIRVFFHPHGSKLLLLLSGYDKLKHSSANYQQKQIQHARKLLKNWVKRQNKTKAE
jgi:hypothetical protein